MLVSGSSSRVHDARCCRRRCRRRHPLIALSDLGVRGRKPGCPGCDRAAVSVDGLDVLPVWGADLAVQHLDYTILEVLWVREVELEGVVGETGADVDVREAGNVGGLGWDEVEGRGGDHCLKIHDWGYRK